MKKLISLLLAAALISSMASFALAYELIPVTYEHENLGGLANDSGQLYGNGTATSQPGIVPFASSTMFIMSVPSGVTDLYTTYSAGLSFSKTGLTNGYLKVSGIVTRSGSISHTTKVGACFYNSDNIFVSVAAGYFPATGPATFYAAASAMSDGNTHYGFAKNEYSGETLTGGSVTYSNATNGG